MCATITLNCNGSPSEGLHILQTNVRLQNVISLAWVYANVRSVGKLTADFNAINKCGSDVGNRTFTQYEARAKRSHAQNKQCQCHNYTVPYILAVLYLMNRLSGIDFEHRHQSNSNLFYLFKHVSQYNGAKAKSDPQIATKTGNPAGLLFRRIWYSVGKSGVLGITEYRQGRPLDWVIPYRSTVIGLNSSLEMAGAPESTDNKCCELHSVPKLVKKTSKCLTTTRSLSLIPSHDYENPQL